MSRGATGAEPGARAHARTRCCLLAFPGAHERAVTGDLCDRDTISPDGTGLGIHTILPATDRDPLA